MKNLLNPPAAITRRPAAVRLARTGAIAVLISLVAISVQAADQTWDGGSTGGGTAWLTAANWVGDTGFPGSQTVATNTDIATFGATGTSNSPGINFNFTGNTLSLGAINVIGNVSRSIGNSSSSATGTLLLNGATVNGVSNVILRNTGTSTLTLDKNQTGAMNVTLGNAMENVVNVENGGNVVITSNLAGDGRVLTVNAASSGDLRLSGANNYSGGTNVTGGTAGGRLRVDTTASLPITGVVAVSTGGRITLFVAGTYGGTSQALTFNPNQTANPSLDTTSNTAVTWQGAVALNADTRIEANGSNGSLTFSNTLSGAGTLIKQAAGNLILSGSGNNATGGTTVGNGTITVNSASRLGTGALTFAQTGTNNTAVTLNNAAQTVAGLSSAFAATTGTQTQTLTLNGTALTVNQSTNTTFGTGAVSTLTSTITGSGSLTKSGAGTLALTGTNSFIGATTINAGTLQASVGALVSTSGVTVNSGGTLLLAGNGRHLGNATGVTLNGGTLNTGGFSEPSASAGGSNIGALTLTANSVIDFGMGASSILEFGGVGMHTAGTALQIINWDGTPLIGGSGDRLLFLGSATDFASAYNQADVSFNGATGYVVVPSTLDGYYEVTGIVPVPEPTTVLAGLLALGTLGYSQRHRVRGFLDVRRGRSALPVAA